VAEIVFNRKLAVSVMFSTVKLELDCGDSYEAQVLYDDILDRLKAGEGLTLSMGQQKSEGES
jgi:hypothetical protein